MILNDGSEHIVRYHHSAIEEAADLEEVATSIHGKTVAMVEVSWWAPYSGDPLRHNTSDD